MSDHLYRSVTLAFLLMGSAAAAESSHFTNVAKDVGLEGVRAKDVVLTDLDGDGSWDLVCDRQRFYRSSKGGKSFVLHEDHGIDFPEVEVVPMAQDGSPDREKAKTRPFAPQYLYFADLDNDGDQDAIWGVHSSWETPDARGNWVSVPECDHGLRTTVYLNDGKGEFERAKPSPFTSEDAAGPAMALAILDHDGDGKLDLYEGREYRRYGHLDNCGVDRLWKGDGKGGFTDVTEAAGLLTVPQPALPNSSRPSYGVTHADVNGDGWQDLLQMAYGRQWNYLWQNDGDGTFTEVGMSSGYAGDDITHGRYPDWLPNPRAPEKPFRSNGNTFDCAVGDVDNDGDLDLFLGGIAHAWAGEASDPPSFLANVSTKDELLFERHPAAEFLPKREWRDPRNNQYGDLHVAWFDYDNDTRLDLLIGSGDYPDGQFLRLYHQQPDGSFTDATKLAGFDWEGCGGLSLGDYDRDGDVDIFAGRSFMRLNQAHRDRFMGGIKVNEVGVFRNDHGAHHGNHWLNVRLVGKGARGANASGIGARIIVTTGDITQTREIRSGSGLSNHQDPPEASFGLGKAKKIDRLVVRWNDKAQTEQVLENVKVDQFLLIEQDK